jgi:hypothetical protein
LALIEIGHTQATETMISAPANLIQPQALTLQRWLRPKLTGSDQALDFSLGRHWPQAPSPYILAAAEIAQSGNNDPMDRTGASGDHLLKGFSVCN